MRLYVIERDLTGEGSLDAVQLRDIARATNAALRDMTKAGADIQWEHSYATVDRIYCVYLADSEETIRDHARRAGLPCTKVSCVREIIGPLTEATGRA